MTDQDPRATAIPEDLIARTGDEITRVLESLMARSNVIATYLKGGALLFQSRLLFLDPARQYLIIELSADPAANAALLARPSANFMTQVGSWHIEFAVEDPLTTTHGGAAAIRLGFPAAVVTHQRRATRTEVPAEPPLRCIADAGGVIPFGGHIVDISQSGVGLLYDVNITLAPRTLLEGCRVEPPGEEPVTVDLMVRYSLPVALTDGGHALRSGCQFVNPSTAVKKLVGLFVGEKF